MEEFKTLVIKLKQDYQLLEADGWTDQDKILEYNETIDGIVEVLLNSNIEAWPLINGKKGK